jgi:predicted RNase H-like nuclease (RuvC/YqgF family)
MTTDGFIGIVIIILLIFTILFIKSYANKRKRKKEEERIRELKHQIETKRNGADYLDKKIKQTKSERKEIKEKKLLETKKHEEKIKKLESRFNQDFRNSINKIKKIIKNYDGINWKIKLYKLPDYPMMEVQFIILGSQYDEVRNFVKFSADYEVDINGDILIKESSIGVNSDSFVEKNYDDFERFPLEKKNAAINYFVDLIIKRSEEEW